MNKQAFYDACRVGVMGPTLQDVRPSFASSNAANRREVYACFCGYDRATSRVCANGHDHRLIQARISVPHPIGNSAVGDGVTAIAPCVTPVEIFRPIVQRIAIPVANHRSRRWRFAMKCLRHKAVNLFRLDRLITANRNLRSAGAIDRLGEYLLWPSTRVRNAAPDTPEIGRFVIGGGRDGAPNLFVFHLGNIAQMARNPKQEVSP